MTNSCPACGSTAVAEKRYAKDIEFKGIDLHVEGLLHYVCESCDYVFETHAQHDSNIDVIRSVFVATRSEFKVANNLLTGLEIRGIRKMLGLTQHEAAEHFGGGLNAFSKYENEEIVQSFAMDRLIRLVAYLGIPGLEALKEAAFQTPTSLAVLRQANTGTSAQVAVIDTNRKMLVAIKRHPGEPLALWGTRSRFSSHAWSAQPMELPTLAMHNAVSDVSGTRVFDLSSVDINLPTVSAAQVEVDTFGTNPLTGAMFRMKHAKAKKELANEISE